MNDQDGGSPAEESNDTSNQDQSQWNNLAELLGAKPSAETPAPKAKAEEPVSRRSVKDSPAPKEKKTPKPTNWGALAGDLGLDAEPDPEPAVAATPEPAPEPEKPLP